LVNLGIEIEFVQDNHSFSSLAGTVRGLHFQAPPDAQAKLVHWGRGRLFDVVVDVRNGSPTYAKWFGIELSFEIGKQLLIPEGFLQERVRRGATARTTMDAFAPEGIYDLWEQVLDDREPGGRA
jgi:dTDP-4-dehydrorhamnose 3,5-epimerase